MKIEMQELLESIKKLIEKSNIEHYHTDEKDFIAWCTTNEGVSRFLSLYEAAKESGMLENSFLYSVTQTLTITLKSKHYELTDNT